MFEGITTWLSDLADAIPLELFVTIGGVIEEIVAPIPSPVVNAIAGSIAREQELGLGFLLWLALLSSLAKTLGAWLFYALGWLLEDAVVPRYGKYIGVKQSELERFSEHFQGGYKDDVILLILRAIPVMPSTPVSLCCGVLKMKQRTFFLATIVGFFFRSLFFIWLGYTGIQAADSLLHGINSAESALTVVIFLGVGLLLGWLYWRRRSHHPAGWLRRQKRVQKDS